MDKRKRKVCLAGIFLLITVVISAIGAAELTKPGKPRPPQPVGVSEPAVFALLGAGLVTLGVYAKKLGGKKR